MTRQGKRRGVVTNEQRIVQGSYLTEADCASTTGVSGERLELNCRAAMRPE